MLLAANEIAVGAFLQGNLPFSMISEVISSALEGMSEGRLSTIEDIIETAELTRKYVLEKFNLHCEKYTWSLLC